MKKIELAKLNQLKEINKHLKQILQGMAQTQSYCENMTLYLAFLSRAIQGGAHEDDKEFWQAIEREFGVHPTPSNPSSCNKSA